MTKFKLIFLSPLFFFGCTPSFAGESAFRNLDKLKSTLNFSEYYSQKPVRSLKVAILDKGFYGYEKQIGKTLPKSTIYHKGPLEAPADLKVNHGLAMAQIFTALATNEGRASQLVPQLHLYNVFGFTNFKAAIDDMIRQKVDLVLYSEVWELGGNSDGRGFVNAEVNRATAAGIIWINAAGNFNNRTYRSRIENGNEDWVQLPDQNQALSFTCEAENNVAKKCFVRVVLTWNDFKNDENAGSDKDLDLALTDDFLNILQTSALKQSADRNESRPGYSKYPREAVQAEVKPGNYFIRVKNRSRNFTEKDELRITIDGESIVSQSAKARDTLLNPADNATVITVGASDTDRSSRGPGMGKPDILAPSSIVTNEKEEFRGSSNSAAIFAAGVAIMKALHPDYSKEKLLRVLGRESFDEQRGVSRLRLSEMAFLPTGPQGCFEERREANLPKHILALISQGGKLVNTNVGYRIMLDFDPLILTGGLRRNLPNDMIISTPVGFRVENRFERRPFPAQSIEAFQQTADSVLCGEGFELKTAGKRFKMPRIE